MMYEINETGGARIGMINATWPFAKLTVNKDVLTLSAGIAGKLVFSQSNIISIEPYSGMALLGSGIRINHNVSEYNSNVIFWTFSNPADLINRIGQTGFLSNTNPGSYIPDASITLAQKQSGFPIKIPAIITIVVIWNLLFAYDFYNLFTKKTNNPINIGGQLALAFMVLTCISLLTLEPIQRLILKEGRSIKDIRLSVYFVLGITGFMLLMSFVPGSAVS